MKYKIFHICTIYNVILPGEILVKSLYSWQYQFYSQQLLPNSSIMVTASITVMARTTIFYIEKIRLECSFNNFNAVAKLEYFKQLILPYLQYWQYHVASKKSFLQYDYDWLNIMV